MRAFGLTDIGKQRRMNQDYVFASEDQVGNLPNLFIVADGMGGHQAGELASQYCVTWFVEYVRNSSEQNISKLIIEGIEHINQKLLKMASSSEEYTGMGTTFLVAVVQDDRLYVGNVGDSRLYICNHEKIRQVTVDHSLVEEMVKAAQITRERARNHPDKNIITKAIGGLLKIDPDVFVIEIGEKDVVLMCSDGLSNMLMDEEIKMIIEDDESISRNVNTLIDRANHYGGKDNIAVIIIKKERGGHDA